jgi:hypothetical protein
MLRHIISVSLASLAMTACASLIPIKANAASLILVPIQDLSIKTIQRNPGDSLGFALLLDYNEVNLGLPPLEIQGYSVSYDQEELSLVRIDDPIALNTQINNKTVTLLARYIFEVLEPVKDGKGDISAIANYREPPNLSFPERFVSISTDPLIDPFYDVEPVPEPLTIFGTAIGLGCGVLFRRKSSKKTVS